ncbi:MAG: glutamate mutase L [Xanthomonadales bacterium]|jgi:uncharacterized protein (TIGR01319 family)|nr:glutamate mutase L [Xanthomonadales bacterium]
MSRRVQALVADIGSTTTLVSAFDGLDSDEPRLLGQGAAATSVLQGDVRAGLGAAISVLEEKLGQRLEWDHFLASSSAAGGLKMTVHGLVKDMTVRAAREAALGAGANIHLVTAGKLGPEDLEDIHATQPNILLLAGGVDYGEKETVLHNAEQIADKGPDCPVIYAGNVAARSRIERILGGGHRRLYIVDNVYPAIDRLEVESSRRVIQEVFEAHITEAPGMAGIRELVGGRIVPTPGAVMDAARLLREDLGDLAVIDVGGATTDIHAVCEDSDEFGRLLIAPEPLARRSVEGDLGTFVSRLSVLDAEPGTSRRIATQLNIDETELQARLAGLPAVPETDDEKELAGVLARESARLALERHAGRIRTLYGPTGKTRIAEGKDLTGIGILVATGGALTLLPDRIARLGGVLRSFRADLLVPSPGVPLAFDNHYVMAAAGVLSTRWPQGALALIKASLADGQEVPV